MPQWVGFVLGFLILYAMLALLGGGIFLLARWAKREDAKLKEKSSQSPQAGVVYFDDAKVIKKDIRNYSLGLKQPKCVVEFGVLFSTSEGEKFFLVTEEVYARLSEGQIGTLVVMNGQFCDFGEGEEIEEN